jgi:hypothetical protein
VKLKKFGEHFDLLSFSKLCTANKQINKLRRNKQTNAIEIKVFDTKGINY